MARLPKVGGDVGNWGEVLNDFLKQTHNDDGSLKPLSQSRIVNLTSDLAGKVSKSDLVPVATSGSYTDLMDTPTIPTTAADVDAVSAAGLDAATTDLVSDGSSATSGALRAAFAPTGQEWIDSWAADVFARPQPEDTPVLTWAAGMTTALTAPVEYKIEKVGIGTQTTGWDGQSDPAFRLSPGVYETGNGAYQDLSLYGATKPGGGAQAARWPITVTFDTSATDTLEIAGYSRQSGGGVMVEVNGQMLTDATIYRPLGTGSWRCTLTFPTPKSRRVSLIIGGATGLSYVRVPTGHTVTKPTEVIKRRIAIIGDSYVNGAGGAGKGLLEGTVLTETFAPRLARFMGADGVMLAGIGGTGWVAGGATNAYYTRLPVVLATNPDVLVFYGSINDGAAGTGVQPAVESVLAQCTSVPEVYVIGPLLNNYDANHAAVKAGTDAAGRRFINMRNFLFGSGKVDAPAGDGNRDLFLLPDGAHPNLYAHKAIARAIFTRMQRPA